MPRELTVEALTIMPSFLKGDKYWVIVFLLVVALAYVGYLNKRSGDNASDYVVRMKNTKTCADLVEKLGAANGEYGLYENHNRQFTTVRDCIDFYLETPTRMLTEEDN